MAVRTVEGGAGLGTMLRAALPALPGVNQLPGVKKSGGATLPDLTVTRPSVTVERDHVAAYASVCGFPVKDVVPVPYPHLLAFPLHMAIMTDASFPFPAIGTVHLENSIRQHRPVRIGETLSVTARAENLRPHAKGRIFDLDVTVESDGETVWDSTSTYLRIGQGDKEHGDRGTPFEDVHGAAAPWTLPDNLGRKYAAVSGDRNPIHLYPLTAKALGFKRQIAHGMWTKARAIAAIENRLPDAVRVDVAFKKPIFLPGTVQFGMRTEEDGIAFSVSNPRDGSPHLLGRTRGL